MFFAQDDISVTIIDVLKFKMDNSRHLNRGISFNALSFRISADAQIITDSQKVKVGDGAITFFPAMTRYTRISVRDELIAVHFYIDGRCFDGIELFTPDDYELYKGLFEELYECWNEKKHGYKNRAKAIFYSILAAINGDIKKDENIRKSDAPVVRDAIEILEKSYFDPSLTVERLAERAHVSESYLRRVFKEHYGISPKKYIIKLRIERAKRLLSAGYHSVGEISYMSGFEDPKYFAVEFKRLVGVSPSKYEPTE
ncbi:MAG: helix-turn-helix transcriptional regulator [Clostridia bacterium]|nr:helix-turn-helix transcriptional regulator [Clostridia bacterium]